MNGTSVPTIFARTRVRSRSLRLAARGSMRSEKPFLWAEICEDMAERLAFVRLEPARALMLGAWHDPLPLTGEVSDVTVARADTWDIEAPFGTADHDFIGVVGMLDAVNDLPGALIHIRNALKPGGLAIASFLGGASLRRLRAAMQTADGERPAARIHPMVDPRAAPQLLQRAGWKDPVVDTRTLTVRYSSLGQLVADLRDHGLTSALAHAAPPLGKAALARATAAFSAEADPDGKVSETFEIITLTGRRSLAGT